MQTASELGELFLRAFILRRVGLIQSQASDVILLGSSHSAGTLRMQEFFTRNSHPYTYLDVDRDKDVQVLLDRGAIESGAASRGEAYKFVHLGHGYCANPYWAQCQHRMACQRCDFYVPGDSTRAQALEANTHNQRLMEQIPITETERKALAGDQAALQQLIEASPTPVSCKA